MDAELIEFNTSLSNYFTKNPTCSVVICTHRSPDGDAAASVIGMHGLINFLAPLAKITILTWGSNNLNPANWNDNLLNWVSDPGDYIQNHTPDCIVFVDASDLSRFTDSPEKLVATKTVKFCLDHHFCDDTSTFNYSYINTKASSCAELIVMLLKQGEFTPNKELSRQLLQGIITDTGALAYTRPNSFTLAASEWLINLHGLNIQTLNKQLYAYNPETIVLLGQILDRITYVPAKNTPAYVYSYATAQDFKQFGKKICKQAIYAFRDKFLQEIDGYMWGFITSPEDQEAKDWGISFRSNMDPITNLPIQSVNIIAEKLGGTGHVAASGGHVESTHSITHQEVITKIINAINSLP